MPVVAFELRARFFLRCREERKLDLVKMLDPSSKLDDEHVPDGNGLHTQKIQLGPGQPTTSKKTW